MITVKARPVRLRSSGWVKIGEGLYGLPDGSLVVEPGHPSRAPQIRFRGERPRELKPGDLIWDNPPGPSQGVTFGLRTGVQYVGPKAFVTPTQASQLLGKSRVWVYRLIRSGKLHPRKRGRTGTILIPLSQIKRFLNLSREPIRPIRPGALWGYDQAGQPWLVG